MSPPRFVPNSLSLTPTGRFRFQISSPAAASVVVEASDDLTNWAAISTNRLPAGGILALEDISSPAYQQRFYRAMTLP